MLQGSLDKKSVISIVTPSFNQGLYLEKTILSVLAQEWPNLQYVLVDGDSSDDSVSIIRRHASRLHKWLSEKDEGMYDAINKGFAHTDGAIMGWLNSDDLYFPWTLRLVGEIFAQFPQVEWITTRHPFAVDTEGRAIATRNVPGFSRSGFRHGDYTAAAGWRALGFIPQESTFWRRSLWEKAGPLDKGFQCAGDFDLWARFFNHAPLWGIGVPLGIFRRQPEQTSGVRFAQYLEETKAVLHREAGKLPSFFKQRLRIRLLYGALSQLMPLKVRRGLVGKAHFIDYCWATGQWQCRIETPDLKAYV